MLLHAVDPVLAPAARSGRPAGPEELRPELHLTAAARRRADELLASREIGARPFAVLAPGGRSSPRWPPASFARLALALAGEMQLAVLIEGSPGEAGLLQEIAAEIAMAAATAEAGETAETTATVEAAETPEAGEVAVRERRSRILICQDPLDVFAALLERARVLIGNDSGPLHLAAALGVPSLYFAPREKLAHSHPQGAPSWALYDELANDPRRISIAQVLGALREMRRRGVIAGAAA
jgi:ADP-heptose:LPS heptosyltransferase